MIKKCIICDGEFEARNRTATCSAECRAEKKRGAWRDFRDKNSGQIAKRKAACRLEAKLTGPRRQCVVCGSDITALRRTRTVCSEVCSVTRRRANERARNKGVFRNCNVCGGRFRVTSTDLTCSPECHEIRQHEHREAKKPQDRVRDRERYWRDREKRLAAEASRRCERAAALKLIREFETKGLEALL